jgi:hypothetical protein
MSNKGGKPTPEVKALSLFLMAFKPTDPKLKQESKRMNRQWDLVVHGKITKEEYLEEVGRMLESYGGYDAVVEKTVKFYIEKSGEWKQNGDDKFSVDSNAIASKILKK